MSKEFWSALSIALTFIAYMPYIHSIFKGDVKPHVFSWLIWGVTTLIVFFAQLSDGGGLGAWITGISGVLVSFIAVLAYLQKSDVSITQLDWCFLIITILSLCLWGVTDDPMISVILLTLMNVVGLGPTARKSYREPHSDGLSFFMIVVPRNLISILALEHYSVTTVFFPATTAIACSLYICMVLYRRRVFSNHHLK